MNRVHGILWAGVALVILAHLLIGLVGELLPFIIVGFILVTIYGWMFKRRW